MSEAVYIIMQACQIYGGVYHNSYEEACNWIKFENPKRRFKKLEHNGNTMFKCMASGKHFVIIELKSAKK